MYCMKNCSVHTNIAWSLCMWGACVGAHTRLHVLHCTWHGLPIILCFHFLGFLSRHKLYESITLGHHVPIPNNFVTRNLEKGKEEGKGRAVEII